MKRFSAWVEFKEAMWWDRKRPWLWLGNVATHVRWFLQRGQRGYADMDDFDMCDYLADVILGMLLIHKKHHPGHPAFLKEEEWESILDEMIYGFEAFGEDDWMLDKTARSEKEVECVFENGMRLLAKYFGNLWR